jgi:(p)ppGpp synthase/HD superfamily hydrolase
MELKDLAFQIADCAFAEKKDKAGKPYMKHLIRVMESVPDWGGGDLRIAAMLHDILEDCPEWTEGALRCIFSERIVDTIVALTHQDHEMYADYIDRICAGNDQWVKTIKIADLKDNMDITRLGELSKGDLDRLSKYHAAYKKLSGT